MAAVKNNKTKKKKIIEKPLKIKKVAVVSLRKKSLKSAKIKKVLNKAAQPELEDNLCDANLRGSSKFKDLFIPHFGNNYQPKFLHPKRLIWHGFMVVLIKLVVVAFVVAMPISAWLTPDVVSQQADKIINLTNEIRKNLNLNLLRKNEILMEAAADKAQDMAVNQYFAHISPKNEGLSFWLYKNSYAYLMAGENLAMGFSNAADVVNGWSKSKTHYANMIDPAFKDVGVGMAIGNYQNYETTFVAQFFGASKNEVAAEVKDIGKISSAVSPPIASAAAAAPEKVFGTKIVAKKEPLATPVLISPVLPNQGEPDNNFTTNKNDLDIRVYAPGAESLVIYLDNNQFLILGKPVENYFATSLTLASGDHDLIFKSIRGQEEISSEPYKITIDQAPPVLDQARSFVYVSDSPQDNQRVVRAEVYLSPDTGEAEINFGNYKIKLYQDEADKQKWTGSTLIFKQSEEQIFSPVVLPNITATDKFGNTMSVDLNWQSIIPIKPSLLNQYFFARENSSPYTRWLFGISSIYYKILLAILILALIFNVFIKIKIQHPRLIISGIGLVVILIILILI